MSGPSPLKSVGSNQTAHPIADNSKEIKAEDNFLKKLWNQFIGASIDTDPKALDKRVIATKPLLQTGDRSIVKDMINDKKFLADLETMKKDPAEHLSLLAMTKHLVNNSKNEIQGNLLSRISNFFARIIGNSTTAKLEKICDEAYNKLDDSNKGKIDRSLLAMEKNDRVSDNGKQIAFEEEVDFSEEENRPKVEPEVEPEVVNQPEVEVEPKVINEESKVINEEPKVINEELPSTEAQVEIESKKSPANIDESSISEEHKVINEELPSTEAQVEIESKKHPAKLPADIKKDQTVVKDGVTYKGDLKNGKLSGPGTRLMPGDMFREKGFFKNGIFTPSK